MITIAFRTRNDVIYGEKEKKSCIRHRLPPAVRRVYAYGSDIVRKFTAFRNIVLDERHRKTNRDDSLIAI